LHETFLLKDSADAEKYLSLPMPTTEGSTEAFFEADQKLGERGIVDVSLGGNPGGTVAELFGSENFAMISATERDIIHALCERRRDEILLLAKYLLSKGVGPYFSMSGEEYIVPPLHGPKDFADFNVRYDEPIIAVIHEMQGRIHIHCHGSVKKVLPGFIAMGTDVLHPIEPPPMGDITAREAKGLARGRLTLEGNIQIAHMYEHAPEQISAEAEALIADAFDDRSGLIVSPTASPYIHGAGEKCLPQYKAMLDAVANWKS
jgi:uroporphyrinogen-III decarboxylase